MRKLQTIYIYIGKTEHIKETYYIFLVLAEFNFTGRSTAMLWKMQYTCGHTEEPCSTTNLIRHDFWPTGFIKKSTLIKADVSIYPYFYIL